MFTFHVLPEIEFIFVFLSIDNKENYKLENNSSISKYLRNSLNPISTCTENIILTLINVKLISRQKLNSEVSERVSVIPSRNKKY